MTLSAILSGITVAWFVKVHDIQYSVIQFLVERLQYQDILKSMIF
jgi:hypothetical protein